MSGGEWAGRRMRPETRGFAHEPLLNKSHRLLRSTDWAGCCHREQASESDHQVWAGDDILEAAIFTVDMCPELVF